MLYSCLYLISVINLVELVIFSQIALLVHYTFCTTKKLGNTDCFSSGCFNNSHSMESVLTVSNSHCIMGFLVTGFLRQS